MNQTPEMNCGVLIALMIVGFGFMALLTLLVQWAWVWAGPQLFPGLFSDGTVIQNLPFWPTFVILWIVSIIFGGARQAVVQNKE